MLTAHKPPRLLLISKPQTSTIFLLRSYGFHDKLQDLGEETIRLIFGYQFVPACPDAQIHMADSSKKTRIIDLSPEGQTQRPLQSSHTVNVRLTKLWEAAGYISQFPEAAVFLLVRAAESCLSAAAGNST